MEYLKRLKNKTLLKSILSSLIPDVFGAEKLCSFFDELFFLVITSNTLTNNKGGKINFSSQFSFSTLGKQAQLYANNKNHDVQIQGQTCETQTWRSSKTFPKDLPSLPEGILLNIGGTVVLFLQLDAALMTTNQFQPINWRLLISLLSPPCPVILCLTFSSTTKFYQIDTKTTLSITWSSRLRLTTFQRSKRLLKW